MLELSVRDWESPRRWRWLLTDVDGVFLADWQVDLDAGSAEYDAFTDLHRYLRLHAAPDRRAVSETELVEWAGRWIGKQVLGAVGDAIAAQRPPTVVQLRLPAEAAVLAFRPLELGYVNGGPLALQRVSFVIHPPNSPTHPPLEGVGGWLRVLALFSLPVDTGALNLRRERYDLSRLIHQIAARTHTAIELRVLQYGVTRERLRDVLEEGDGWDVLHVSGHGLPARLLLEQADGGRDLVSSAELVDLLDLAAGRLKLVTVSSCDSAAATVTQAQRLLGLTPTTDDDAQGDEGDDTTEPAAPIEGGVGVLPAVAEALVARLGCAVVAMRFPVGDDFAITLNRELYSLLLGKGNTLPTALQLALRTATAAGVWPGTPALSVATPALFGAAAADLTLRAPRGGPSGWDPDSIKMAAFPPEPERFVGRVGAMAAATAALAPNSGASGVVFHGMAGAGKTACALELAYGHEQLFQQLVWWKGPDEDHDIAPALVNFALALERQIPGLQMVDKVDNRDRLQTFLPQLTQFLERANLLMVLDNCEALLTDAGDWRDERWGLVIDALTDHQGLSRIIVTTRRGPATLNPTMQVEAVHALSLAEAVLLARELSHLRHLLDRDDAGRALVARTLQVVQGHPKLLELADGQAADPATLTTRLDEADRAWAEGGARLTPFLQHGDSTATPNDYLTVLAGWTRSTANNLPPASRLMFTVLCCIEEPDRTSTVLEDNWADIRARLTQPHPTPAIDDTLAPLITQGLIATQTTHTATEDDADTGGGEGLVVFRIHPGVAESGREAADPAVRTAVDTELAAYWQALFQHAVEREDEQLGWLIRHAGLAAAPYLLRLHHYDTASYLLENSLNRDRSVGSAAAVLPLLRRIADATTGTDHELEHRAVLTIALTRIDPPAATAELGAILDAAEARGQFGVASSVAGQLIDRNVSMGRYREALTLTDRVQALIVQAGLGPWTQLANEGQQLQLRGLLGQHQQVLDRVETLRIQMAALPDDSQQPERIPTWHVRETILNIGELAARDSGRWQLALTLNNEIHASHMRRDAPPLQQARTRLNAYSPLLQLNRIEQAQSLLDYCREVFTAENDLQMLAHSTSALAAVEDELGHPETAVRLGRDGLRLCYAFGDPDGVAASHHNLAGYLQQTGATTAVVLTHRLAAATIRLHTQSGWLTSTLQAVGGVLAGGVTPPGSFAELSRRVEADQGLAFATLIAGLPAWPDGPDAALTDILTRARAHHDTDTTSPSRPTGT